MNLMHVDRFIENASSIIIAGNGTLNTQRSQVIGKIGGAFWPICAVFREILFRRYAGNRTMATGFTVAIIAFGHKQIIMLIHPPTHQCVDHVDIGDVMHAVVDFVAGGNNLIKSMN